MIKFIIQPTFTLSRQFMVSSQLQLLCAAPPVEKCNGVPSDIIYVNTMCKHPSVPTFCETAYFQKAYSEKGSRRSGDFRGVILFIRNFAFHLKFFPIWRTICLTIQVLWSICLWATEYDNYYDTKTFKRIVCMQKTYMLNNTNYI